MSFEKQQKERSESAAQDAEMEQVLGNFRSSVKAWSEAEMSRPRTVISPSHKTTWRLAASWAMGCVLAAGAASGALYGRHYQAEQQKIAAAKEAEHQRELAAQRAREDEELLARVDTAISKEVPSAMEPLANLMAEDESK